MSKNSSSQQYRVDQCLEYEELQEYALEQEGSQHEDNLLHQEPEQPKDYQYEMEKAYEHAANQWQHYREMEDDVQTLTSGPRGNKNEVFIAKEIVREPAARHEEESVSPDPIMAAPQHVVESEPAQSISLDELASIARIAMEQPEEHKPAQEIQQEKQKKQVLSQETTKQGSFGALVASSSGESEYKPQQTSPKYEHFVQGKKNK